MRQLYIPNILFIGSESRVWRRRLYMAFIIALFFHAALFIGFEQLRNLSVLTWLRPINFPPVPAVEKALQFVVVDEDLLTEEKPDDDLARLRGRVTRTSRDTEIDQTKPLTGPSGSETERNFDAFKTGETSPVARSNPSPNEMTQPIPEAAPQNPTTAQPAQKAQTPQEITPPQEVVKEIKEVKEIEKVAATPPEIAPAPNPAPEITDVEIKMETPLILREQENVIAITPQTTTEKSTEEKMEKTATNEKITKTENIEKTETAESAEKVEKTEPLEKVEAKEKTEPAEKPVEKTAPTEPLLAQAEITPQQQIAPSKPVPSRRIGTSAPPTDGGKLRQHSGSAAMQAGIKSMAVLRDRYGEYMDILLRRIQAAIYIQQQLSPPMFNRGVVVFTFTISANGHLENVNFLGTQPEDLTQETAISREVLTSVQQGEALPKPSIEMLHDPDFQKITVNFLFEPR